MKGSEGKVKVWEEGQREEEKVRKIVKGME